MSPSGKALGRVMLVLGLAGGLGSCIIGEHPFWDPDSADDAGSDTGAPTTGSTDVAASTVDGSETMPPPGTDTSAESTEGMTTDPPGSMGQPCIDFPRCDEGQSCCRSLNCMDTCLILCGIDESVCPDNMDCAHGYCLLHCNDNDNDCAAWPGFTCQHDGTLCENLEPSATGSSTG